MISQNIAGSLNQGGGSHRERQTGIMLMFRVDRPVKISKYEEKKKKKDFIIKSFGLFKAITV